MQTNVFENCKVLSVTSSVKEVNEKEVKTVSMQLKNDSCIFWAWFRFGAFTKNIAEACTDEQAGDVQIFLSHHSLTDEKYLNKVFGSATLKVTETHYLKDDVCFFTDVDENGAAVEGASVADHEFSTYAIDSINITKSGINAINAKNEEVAAFDKINTKVEMYKKLMGENIDDDKFADFVEKLLLM